MTRLVCIGDCHFGPQGGRNDDRYRSLDQIIASGLALDALGAWLVAGDVNHARMTIEDRNALAPRFQAMANRAPVLIVRGNHDHDGDLLIFTRLETQHGIQLVTEASVFPLRLATGAIAAVFALPYVFKGGLVSAGVAHADLGQTARDYFDAIFVDASERLREPVQAGALPLMLAHMNIGGAISSTGQPSIGLEIELDPALLARVGDIPKIFGHIHRAQHIHGAYYLGSIARMDFGEAEEKSFAILEYRALGDWSLSVVPLAVPGQHTVEGRLTRDAFTIATIDGVSVSEAERSWTGADIKCKYSFVAAELRALDVARIHAEFAGCRSLKLEPLPEAARDVRAPEIVAATTLEAKVEAYCRRQGLDWSAGLGAKLAALQSQDSVTLLSGITAAAAAAGAAPIAHASVLTEVA